MSFDSFEIDPALLAGVRDLGFEQPTDIQQDAIPWALEGRDVLACAMTGSGKTAAFGLPILERLIGLPAGKTRALILSPTRELASQIEEHLAELGAHTSIRVASIYGGVAYEPQEKAFRDGYEILVATPGRLIDHLRRPYANLDDVEVLVLDEADRMLDMGFIPDVRRILQQVPKERQTLFFSATLPAPIVRLANDMLQDPVTINLERKSLPAEGVRQAAYPVRHELKPALLLHLLEKHQVGSALVFTRTRDRADQVGEYLRRAGEKVAVIHGDRTQQHRTKAMDAFKKGNFRVLVATDVAARGIDIEELDVVVNLDVPSAAEDYIHRVGRTARAGATGDAWTFVAARELADLHLIEKSIGKKLERIRPEDFDYSPASLSAISRPPVAASVPVLDAVDEDDLVEGATEATADPEAGVPSLRPDDGVPTDGAAAASEDEEREEAGGDETIALTDVSATNEETGVTEKKATSRRGRRTTPAAAREKRDEGAEASSPVADEPAPAADAEPPAEPSEKPAVKRVAKPAAGRSRSRSTKGRTAARSATPPATEGGVRRPWFLAPLEEDELAAIELELATEPDPIEEEDDVEPPTVGRREAASTSSPRQPAPSPSEEERAPRAGRGRGRRGRGGARGQRDEAPRESGGERPPRPVTQEGRDDTGGRSRGRRRGRGTSGAASSGRREAGAPARQPEVRDPAAGDSAGVVERFARLRSRREGDRLSREVIGGVEDTERGRGGGGRRGEGRGRRGGAIPERAAERRDQGGGGGRSGRGGGDRRSAARESAATSPAVPTTGTRSAAPNEGRRGGGDGRSGPRFGASRAAEVRRPPTPASRRPRPIQEGEAEEQPPAWWTGGPAHGESIGGRRPDSRRPAHSLAAERSAAGRPDPEPEPERDGGAAEEEAPAARRPPRAGARARRTPAPGDDRPAAIEADREDASAPRPASPALERFAALRARRARRGGGDPEAERS